MEAGKRLSRNISLSRPLPRNEEGAILDEQWENADFLSCYFTVDGPESLETFVKNDLDKITASLTAEENTPKPNLLVIIDTIEKTGEQGLILLTEILTSVRAHENRKLLLLGNTNTVKDWVLSSDVVRHNLRQLLQVQRRQAVNSYTNIAPSEVEIGIGTAAAIPAYFALALEARNGGEQA